MFGNTRGRANINHIQKQWSYAMRANPANLVKMYENYINSKVLHWVFNANHI